MRLTVDDNQDTNTTLKPLSRNRSSTDEWSGSGSQDRIFIDEHSLGFLAADAVLGNVGSCLCRVPREVQVGDVATYIRRTCCVYSCSDGSKGWWRTDVRSAHDLGVGNGAMFPRCPLLS